MLNYSLTSLQTLVPWILVLPWLYGYKVIRVGIVLRQALLIDEEGLLLDGFLDSLKITHI